MSNAIIVGLLCMGPAIFLARSLGRKRALEMLLTGIMKKSDDAEKWGLVNKVVPADQFKKAIMSLANKLVKKKSNRPSDGKTGVLPNNKYGVC